MKKTKKNNRLEPYIYVSPLLISIFFLSFLPIIYTVWISFTNYNLDHMQNHWFVGLENYKVILFGPLKDIFFPVFAWTVVFATISALGCYFVGLMFALVLNNENIRERNIYKSFLIIPWAIPATIALLTWKGLLNEQYGGINILLSKLHIISANIPWMTDQMWARVAILMVNIWLGFPWMMNICLGALSSIDSTFYEASEIDGATKWQQFIKITLPSITTSSLPLIISSFAFNFNNFGVAFLITEGGPPRMTSQYAGYTDILVSAGYKMANNSFKYNYSAALSVLVFFIIGTISIIQMNRTNAFKEVD